MEFSLRVAGKQDADAIGELIADSVRGLAKGIYSDEQIELSLQTVFGVDHQLIADGTYFVAENEGRIVGCGGWSKRKTLYGSSVYADSRDPDLLDPKVDAAKIRAFFVHPDAARHGIARAILKRCEAEAADHGFAFAEMMATLPGVPLYEACGYKRLEPVAIRLSDDLKIECIEMRKDL